jgi:hypothetical protein
VFSLAASQGPTRPAVGISLGIAVGLVSCFPLVRLFQTMRYGPSNGFMKIMGYVSALVALWVGGKWANTGILAGINAADILDPYLISLVAIVGPVMLILLIALMVSALGPRGAQHA